MREAGQAAALHGASVHPRCHAGASGADACPCPSPCQCPCVSAGLCSVLAAPCGGTVRNATIGRVLSPSYTGNQSGSMYCVWAIGAPPGQKLHLHFEKLLLTEKDR